MSLSATTRNASLSGVLRHHRPGIAFRGEVQLSLRPDCVYYTWRLEDEDGGLLGAVSRPVSLRTIPPGNDPFEFALAHALEGIRRYRLGRVKPFDVQSWRWET